MRKKHSVRIASEEYVAPWALRVRLTTFISSFGIAWLFHEPLSAFGIGLVISSWGIWGYVYLLTIAILLTGLIEYFSKFWRVGKASFIQIEIILEEFGYRIPVIVPEDMRIGKFVKIFLEKTSLHAKPQSLLAVSSVFNHSLLIKCDSSYKKLSNHKTIKEGGLKNGDECKIQIESIRNEIRDAAKSGRRYCYDVNSIDSRSQKTSWDKE